MTDKTALDFSSVQAEITTQNVTAHASELHGVLSGLICAGLAFNDDHYLSLLSDVFHNGEALPRTLSAMAQLMYDQTWQALLDDAYGFQLMLPDDDDSLQERSHALGVWVQGFNLGFGLQQKDTRKLSAELQEVITDFAEISNLSDDVDEDEISEQAYAEIIEYVRISACLCFSELGKPPETDATKAVLH